MSQAVQAAVSQFPAEFTVTEVKAAIRRDSGGDMNPSSISGCLRRMAGDGKIKVLEIGRGKRPTRYAQIDTQDPQETFEL